jgi:predicted MFS family arabinose efflux permease
MPWQTVFLLFAGIILATLFLLPMMRVAPRAPKAEEEASLSAIVGRAMQDSNYILIFLGFFSCGYQLGFMTAHFPAFITEACGAITPGGFLHSLGITSTSTLGAAALSVIGLTNIAGTLAAGYLGNRYSKKNLLAAVYLARALVTFGFISFPITPLSVLIFSALMGMLWLATVPLTSGLVAYIFGLRYMGTLYGIVFFSHQLGSFIGIWLGGRMFDVYGSYTLVWWIGVGVGLFSALVHLPIREKPTVMLGAN